MFINSLYYFYIFPSVAFCPMKLRLAMLLADFGCREASYEYAFGIKSFITSTEEAHAAAQRGSTFGKDRRGSSEKDRKISKIFNFKFARAVDEFYDRISKTTSEDIKANIRRDSGQVCNNMKMKLLCSAICFFCTYILEHIWTLTYVRHHIHTPSIQLILRVPWQRVHLHRLFGTSLDLWYRLRLVVPTSKTSSIAAPSMQPMLQSPP